MPPLPYYWGADRWSFRKGWSKKSLPDMFVFSGYMTSCSQLLESRFCTYVSSFCCSEEVTTSNCSYLLKGQHRSPWRISPASLPCKHCPPPMVFIPLHHTAKPGRRYRRQMLWPARLDSTLLESHSKHTKRSNDFHQNWCQRGQPSHRDSPAWPELTGALPTAVLLLSHHCWVRAPVSMHACPPSDNCSLASP